MWFYREVFGWDQSFRGAGLGYIKHIIDTEYLYLYDQDLLC